MKMHFEDVLVIGLDKYFHAPEQLRIAISEKMKKKLNTDLSFLDC